MTHFKAINCSLLLLLLLLLTCSGSTLFAQPNTDAFRIEGAVSFSMFQQQVKPEIGGEQGQRLVHESEIGFGITGSYGVLDFLSVGLFVRGWSGIRENAQFAGFDDDGAAATQNQLGGSYSEMWIGPLIHLHYKQLFADVGYALSGLRSDAGRSDIFSEAGDNTSAFGTDPSFAWLVSVGGSLPVTENLSIVIKADYCIRYYNRRGGELLANNIVHGTQSLAPSIGVAWMP